MNLNETIFKTRIERKLGEKLHDKSSEPKHSNKTFVGKNAQLGLLHLSAEIIFDIFFLRLNLKFAPGPMYETFHKRRARIEMPQPFK